MNVKTANALIGYFETLYDLNRDLIALCGADVIANAGQYEKHIKDVIQAVPRLVPYVYNKSEQRYIIDDHDGLLEFSDDLPFLKDDYEKLLRQHLEFLSDIKRIRNKFEHKMHGVRKIAGASSGMVVDFNVTYEIGNNWITIMSSELISFTKDINCIFAKIQELVDSFAQERGVSDYAYYRRLIRYNFRDFNRIYDSDVLAYVGKALFPF